MTHEFWYLSRAAGITAYLLLFVSVALGLAVSTRMGDRLFRRAAVFDLHRFTTVLALLASVVHVLVLLGDGYFHFSVWQLSVPFLSPYRPWQTAAGVFSIYALALLVLSFYVRRFIGFRAWRTLHYLTFALYAGATLHGVTAGSDTTQVWARAMYLGTGAVIVALLALRLRHAIPSDTSVRVMRVAAGVAASAVVLVLLLGTGLFHDGEPQASTAAALVTAPRSLPATFEDQIAGTFRQSQEEDSGRFSLEGTASGDVPLRLTVELAFQGQSEVANSAQVLEAVSGMQLCTGAVTAVNRGYLAVTCEGTGPYDGVTMNLAMRVSTTEGGSFSGRMSAQVQPRDGA